MRLQSTFNTDFTLVPEAELTRAIASLRDRLHVWVEDAQ